MIFSSFNLPRPWVEVNSRCLKRQIILISGTTSQSSPSPYPMSEDMSLKNAELLKQDNPYHLQVPASARRVRKIFNLYIQRWRSSTLIFESGRWFFCSALSVCSHIFPFVADSKALHLERSHTKAILKGLSMYIHYQRDYWLKHDRGLQSKKLVHYFKKAWLLTVMTNPLRFLCIQIFQSLNPFNLKLPPCI